MTIHIPMPKMKPTITNIIQSLEPEGSNSI